MIIYLFLGVPSGGQTWLFSGKKNICIVDVPSYKPPFIFLIGDFQARHVWWHHFWAVWSPPAAKLLASLSTWTVNRDQRKSLQNLPAGNGNIWILFALKVFMIYLIYIDLQKGTPWECGFSLHSATTDTAHVPWFSHCFATIDNFCLVILQWLNKTKIKKNKRTRNKTKKNKKNKKNKKQKKTKWQDPTLCHYSIPWGVQSCCFFVVFGFLFFFLFLLVSWFFGLLFFWFLVFLFVVGFSVMAKQNQNFF